MLSPLVGGRQPNLRTSQVRQGLTQLVVIAGLDGLQHSCRVGRNVERQDFHMLYAVQMLAYSLHQFLFRLHFSPGDDQLGEWLIQKTELIRFFGCHHALLRQLFVLLRLLRERSSGEQAGDNYCG